MSNRIRTCKHCKNKKIANQGFQSPVNWFCDRECAMKHSINLSKKIKEKKQKEAAKSQAEFKRKVNRAHTEHKKKVKPIKEWQDKLQKLVNQFIVHVRDKDKPCCTCGTDSPSIKYDAGHYRTRAAAPEIRYELTNIHKQCSVKCNQQGSGMRKEYQGFIEYHYGAEHLVWLDGSHDPLKVRFPHWSDYETEIKRYRSLLREHGVKPIV